MAELAPTTADVTAIVPGKNCAATLPACLDALTRVRERGLLVDIVFVDDGCEDESATIARTYGATVLESGGHGPGAARNTGWRVVQSKWVWFVDSDCVVEPDALSRLVERQRALDAAAVGGSYANARPHSLTARLIHAEMVTRHRRIGEVSDFAITANLLCEHAVLQELGGFDEALQLAQDLDLAYRIVDSQRVLGFEWRSRVAHFHEASLLRYLYKQARQGYWRMQLYRKHPRRVRGDRYSGWLDYAQPPAAVLAFGASVVAAGAAAVGAPVVLNVVTLSCALGLAAVLILQLPLALRIEGVSALERWAYVGFGAARALTRGIGMLAGLLHAARGRNIGAAPRTRTLHSR